MEPLEALSVEADDGADVIELAPPPLLLLLLLPPAPAFGFGAPDGTTEPGF